MIMNQTYPDEQFFTPFQPQSQDRQPGFEHEMAPLPIFDHPKYNQVGKRLLNKVAIITGGDSGIGRAISVAFAHQGAKVVIVYLNEHQDAETTKEHIEAIGGECIILPYDLTKKDAPKTIVQETLKRFGTIDILVNNHAQQTYQNDLTAITDEQLMTTFEVNFFSIVRLTREIIPHLKAGASIINTTSVTAYRGSGTLIDYSSTKGALTTFTRSLALNLAPKQIRVNAVAPGPIWTPLIPASSKPEDIPQFGRTEPLGRPGQPVELGGAYVFLASDESSYMTGQTIHVNGGAIVNG